jgi:transcriptional regulator with XRE-family HTH domain
VSRGDLREEDGGGQSEAAELLLAALRDHGLTQRQVADELGVSPRTLRRLLAGTTPGTKYLAPLRELNATGRRAPTQADAADQVDISTVRLPAGRSLTTVSTPRPDGPGRDAAGRALLQVVQDAKAAGQRVRFTITYGNGTQVLIGGKAGYDPAAVERAIAGTAAGAQAWLDAQLDGGAEPGAVGERSGT